MCGAHCFILSLLKVNLPDATAMFVFGHKEGYKELILAANQLIVSPCASRSHQY